MGQGARSSLFPFRFLVFVFSFSCSPFRFIVFVAFPLVRVIMFVSPWIVLLFSFFSISFYHARFCSLFVCSSSSRFSHSPFRFHFIVLFVSSFRVLCFHLSFSCFVWFALLLHPTQMDQTFFTALCILEICPPPHPRLSSYPSCLPCPSRPPVGPTHGRSRVLYFFIFTFRLVFSFVAPAPNGSNFFHGAVVLST